MTPNKGDKQTRMLSPLITPNKGYKQTRVQSWRNTTVIYLRPEFSLHLFTFHIAQCLSSVKKDAVVGVCVPEIAHRAFSTLGQLDVVCRILHPQFWLLSVAFLELLPPCADPDFVAPTPLQHQQCCPPPKKEKTKSIATQLSERKDKKCCSGASNTLSPPFMLRHWLLLNKVNDGVYRTRVVIIVKLIMAVNGTCLMLN